MIPDEHGDLGVPTKDAMISLNIDNDTGTVTFVFITAHTPDFVKLMCQRILNQR